MSRDHKVRQTVALHTYRPDGTSVKVGDVDVWSEYRGLPPSPTYETLVAYVLPFINDVLDQVAPIDKIGSVIPVDSTRAAALRGDIEGVLTNLEVIMEKRGNAYGEDVLMALGEEAFIILAFTKMMRLLWSWKDCKPFKDRKDSWLDLSGYAILALAVNAYMEDN